MAEPAQRIADAVQLHTAALQAVAETARALAVERQTAQSIGSVVEDDNSTTDTD